MLAPPDAAPLGWLRARPRRQGAAQQPCRSYLQFKGWVGSRSHQAWTAACLPVSLATCLPLDMSPKRRGDCTWACCAMFAGISLPIGNGRGSSGGGTACSDRQAVPPLACCAAPPGRPRMMVRCSEPINTDGNKRTAHITTTLMSLALPPRAHPHTDVGPRRSLWGNGRGGRPRQALGQSDLRRTERAGGHGARGSSGGRRFLAVPFRGLLHRRPASSVDRAPCWTLSVRGQPVSWGLVMWAGWV